MSHKELDPTAFSPSTLAIHADDVLNSEENTDVAPALHVSTTYRYTSDLSKLKPLVPEEVTFPCSRLTYRRN
jgi:cystathionine gamma-synthase